MKPELSPPTSHVPPPRVVSPQPKGQASNAASHGLYSDALVIAGESAERWRAYHDDIVDSLAPVGAVETDLASRAAALLWRLRRVPAAEAALIARDTAQQEKTERGRARTAAAIGPDTFYGQAFATPLPPTPPLPIVEGAAQLVIDRHEAHLNRQLLHALHELEAFQARRRGERTPLARVDVHGLPGA
ncbi:MAG: hypothetical protein HYX50_05205 [Chloroflexi bacterium]|nr:hypothetical protein [Chloroflexota bacterium]